MLSHRCYILDLQFVAMSECSSSNLSNTQCFMLLMITQRALHPVIRQYHPEVSITTIRRWVLWWRRSTQTNVYRLHVYLLPGTLIYLITGDRRSEWSGSGWWTGRGAVVIFPNDNPSCGDDDRRPSVLFSNKPVASPVGAREAQIIHLLKVCARQMSLTHDV